MQAAAHTDQRPPRALPAAARRHPLVTEVARRLSGPCAAASAPAIAVGVSGGADSIALLLAVAALEGRAPRPVAVHVHHHLRSSADGDAAHVEVVCERLGVPLLRRDVHPADAAGGGESPAATARRLRYAALAEAAGSAGTDTVAVAHHAADQFETMLMAMARGAGLDGLAGMAWRRPLEGGPGGTWLVRPLLHSTRRQCEDLCTVAGVGWRDDPTNDDRSTPRGRLRADVMPALEALWPGAAQRAAATAELLETARGLLEERVAALFGAPEALQWQRGALAAAPAPFVAAGLRRAALALRPNVAGALGRAQLEPVVEAIADADRRPRYWQWPGGLVVTVTARTVSIA